MDQETKAFLEAMEARLEARADEREARMNQRLENVEAEGRQARVFVEAMEARLSQRLENVETESRQTRVLVEGMDGNIRLLAEGIMGVTERLEKFQEETADNFKEIKATLSPAYKNLDARVQRLEARAERQTEDVLESIRKTFGKTQA